MELSTLLAADTNSFLSLVPYHLAEIWPISSLTNDTDFHQSFHLRKSPLKSSRVWVSLLRIWYKTDFVYFATTRSDLIITLESLSQLEKQYLQPCFDTYVFFVCFSTGRPTRRRLRRPRQTSRWPTVGTAIRHRLWSSTRNWIRITRSAHFHGGRKQ